MCRFACCLPARIRQAAHPKLFHACAAPPPHANCAQVAAERAALASSPTSENLWWRCVVYTLGGCGPGEVTLVLRDPVDCARLLGCLPTSSPQASCLLASSLPASCLPASLGFFRCAVMDDAGAELQAVMRRLPRQAPRRKKTAPRQPDLGTATCIARHGPLSVKLLGKGVLGLPPPGGTLHVKWCTGTGMMELSNVRRHDEVSAGASGVLAAATGL